MSGDSLMLPALIIGGLLIGLREPQVAQQTQEVIGVNHGLALSTTVRQAGGPMGFANTWTVWLQVNGLYQPTVLREPERRTLLVWCVLPVARG